MVWQKCDARAELDCLPSNMICPGEPVDAPGTASTDRGAFPRVGKGARSDHSGVTLHSLILLLPGGLCSPQHGPHIPAREVWASSGLKFLGAATLGTDTHYYYYHYYHHYQCIATGESGTTITKGSIARLHFSAPHLPHINHQPLINSFTH